MNKYKLTGEDLETLRTLPIGESATIGGKRLKCVLTGEKGSKSCICGDCALRRFLPFCVENNVCFSITHISKRSVYFVESKK